MPHVPRLEASYSQHLIEYKGYLKASIWRSSDVATQRKKSYVWHECAQSLPIRSCAAWRTEYSRSFISYFCLFHLIASLKLSEIEKREYLEPDEAEKRTQARENEQMVATLQTHIAHGRPPHARTRMRTSMHIRAGLQESGDTWFMFGIHRGDS